MQMHKLLHHILPHRREQMHARRRNRQPPRQKNNDSALCVIDDDEPEVAYSNRIVRLVFAHTAATTMACERKKETTHTHGNTTVAAPPV